MLYLLGGILIICVLVYLWLRNSKTARAEAENLATTAKAQALSDTAKVVSAATSAVNKLAG